MKTKVIKIILFLLITATILSIYSPVKAATSYAVELASNENTVEPGEEIEIRIKVKDIVDIPDGIAGLSAKLEYDTTKLERVGEGQSLNGFMLVEGDTIELAKYPGVTSETEIAKFTFKAKEGVTGVAQIKLSGVEVANGTDLFALGKDVIKTITIAKLDVTEPPSSNNNLSSISIDGTPILNFDEDTLIYTLTAVENSKTSIEISAETEDAKATVIGTGTKELNVGENSFNIVVTAEDGTQKTYVVKVERKAIGNNNEDEVNDNPNDDKKEDGKEDPNDDKKDDGKEDPNDETKTPTNLPQTGTSDVIMIIIAMLVAVLAVAGFKLKQYKDI